MRTRSRRLRSAECGLRSGGGRTLRALILGARGRVGLAEQVGVAPPGALAVFEEDRLGAGGGGEFAQLGAVELDELRRRRRPAPALEEGEDREQFGRRRLREVQLHAQRHGVANDGGGEVGRQVQEKHEN